MDFGNKLSKILVAKKAAAAARSDVEDCHGDVDSGELSDCEEVPQFKLVETMEEDPADDEFIRELYSRGPKELLDWDDLGY